MTIALAILLILNCAISKGVAQRIAALYALILISTALVVEFIPSEYWGAMYIGTALAELLIIVIISNKNDDIVLPLMFLCFVSIWLNLYGFVVWVSYLSPDLYNVGQVILNISVTLLFLARRQSDDGPINISRLGRSWVYSHIVTRLDVYKKEGATK